MRVNTVRKTNNETHNDEYTKKTGRCSGPADARGSGGAGPGGRQAGQIPSGAGPGRPHQLGSTRPSSHERAHPGNRYFQQGLSATVSNLGGSSLETTRQGQLDLSGGGAVHR